MTARIIDGNAFAADYRNCLGEHLHQIRDQRHLVPGLAVVLVGDDPASRGYVRSKNETAVAIGMRCFEHLLPAAASEAAVLNLIEGLNDDPAVHGILVQLPLPRHIRAERVFETIDPAKDVDGFHPINVGRLVAGTPGLIPCTPLACMLLLRAEEAELSGRKALVLGRSNIVGKPLAQLLLRENCTVTMVHSRSRDLPGECHEADILIAAMGRPEMVRGDWIKPGAIVLDVGINRISGPGGQPRLVGDVRFAEAVAVAGAITPVPGGVGPVTTAVLLRNTLMAACRQHRLKPPACDDWVIGWR